MMICFYIAYHIFKDDWNDYILGGSGECVIMIFIALIPALNTIVSFSVAVSCLLIVMSKKLKQIKNEK